MRPTIFYKLARAKSEKIDNFSGKILIFFKKTIYLYHNNIGIVYGIYEKQKRGQVVYYPLNGDNGNPIINTVKHKMEIMHWLDVLPWQ